MNRKIFVTGLFLILFAFVSVGWYYFNNNNNNDNNEDRTVREPLLGKTPHSSLCTFGEDFVLYKENVLKNGEKVFSGLYRCNLNDNKDSSTNPQLLSDSFFACANIYRDKVIFINDEYKIQQMDMENSKSKILYDNNGKAIMDALIMDDCLYFIAECDENVCNLLALNLTNNIQKQIIENINPHYLYHYGEGIAVITKDNKFLVKCSFDDGVKEKYSAPENEIQGFFDDGTILLVQNHDTIYQLEDFYADKKTVLLRKENIYRTIMHTDELLVCTLDDSGLMEVYIYDFASKKAAKIANTNFTPLDFNKEYIICGDVEIGMPELINRRTGEFENIVINSANEEHDDEKKDFSLGTIGEGDYKNAISDDELNDLLKIISEYYQNKLSWGVVDYRIADNDHSLYQLYKDYELGNIIVFEVHTTNNPSGLYRDIALGRKKNNKKWKVLNEGI
ncbi:hypothetical protein AALA98_14420 [Lachnospiraceae bacterium 45-W7]